MLIDGEISPGTIEPVLLDVDVGAWLFGMLVAGEKGKGECKDEDGEVVLGVDDEYDCCCGARWAVWLEGAREIGIGNPLS